MQTEFEIIREAYMAGMQAVSDTSPQMSEMVRNRMMALSGAERICLGAKMFDTARDMILESLPPGLSEVERKRQLFKRIYGEDLPF